MSMMLSARSVARAHGPSFEDTPATRRASNVSRVNRRRTRRAEARAWRADAGLS